MLKCIVVSTPDAEFSALAFKEDFKESIRKVSNLGFDAVELAVRDPKMVDFSEIKNTLKNYNLTVPAIGTGQAFGQEGLSFTDPNQEIRNKAVQRIKEQMDFAREIGNAQVIIGLIRGKIGNRLSKEKGEEYFIQCMRECADYNKTIILTVEAINRYETDLYNNIASTKEVIDKIDRPNIKMLIDTFHMNIEDSNISESILKAKGYVSHVHVADSNRWAPGCGHINFEEILKSLRDINYEGAISAEILPLPTPEESALLTIEAYKKWGL